MESFYTVRGIARKLAVTPKAVYRFIERGELDSVRLGARSIRVPRESFERFLREKFEKTRRDLGLDR